LFVPASAGAGVDLPGKAKTNTSRSERVAAASLSSTTAAAGHACAKASTLKLVRGSQQQLVSSRTHYHISEDDGAEKIQVIFVDRDGDEYDIEAPVGRSLLEIAHAHDIELEGACEGSLACSTCHVIVEDEDQYDLLEEPSDDENDMLDLAFGLTETSRLGCQIICAPELDGLRVRIPGATRNFAVDGFVPKPH
jgi:ferredoxin